MSGSESNLHCIIATDSLLLQQLYSDGVHESESE